MSKTIKISTAARLLSVSRPTAWRMATRGDLGPVIGSPMKVRLSELEKHVGPITPAKLEQVT